MISLKVNLIQLDANLVKKSLISLITPNYQINTKPYLINLETKRPLMPWTQSVHVIALLAQWKNLQLLMLVNVQELPFVSALLPQVVAAVEVKNHLNTKTEAWSLNNLNKVEDVAHQAISTTILLLLAVVVHLRSNLNPLNHTIIVDSNLLVKLRKKKEMSMNANLKMMLNKKILIINLNVFHTIMRVQVRVDVVALEKVLIRVEVADVGTLLVGMLAFALLPQVLNTDMDLIVNIFRFIMRVI